LISEFLLASSHGRFSFCGAAVDDVDGADAGAAGVTVGTGSEGIESATLSAGLLGAECKDGSPANAKRPNQKKNDDAKRRFHCRVQKFSEHNQNAARHAAYATCLGMVAPSIERTAIQR